MLPGGYLHGYITTNGQYCNTRSSSKNADKELSAEIRSSGEHSFIIYPNPTTGKFTLEVDMKDVIENIQVEIYSIRGDKVLSTNLTGEKKHLLSLDGFPKGLYVVRVTYGQTVNTCLVMKF